MAHASPITCLDHDPASGRLLTGGYDGLVVCWLDGVEQWQIPFDDLVNDVRFSPDGTRAAVAVADRHAFVLDVADGSTVLALGPHGDDVNVVRWLPGGDGLVCVMDHLDPVVRVWTGKDGTWEARELVGHGSGVFGAALDPEARRVATAAEDRTARVWDLETLAVLQVLTHPGDPEAIDWSPDGSVIATGCDDGLCRLWDPDRGTVVRTLAEAGAAVRFVRFSADGRSLLVGAYDATMRRYDTSTWQVTEAYTAPFQWERAAVQAGARVAVGSFGGSPILHPDGTDAVPTYGINALAVDGATVAVARDDGAVLTVTLERDEFGNTGPSGWAPRVLARHRSIVNAVAFSPDGTTVASADYRGAVHLSPLDGRPAVTVTVAEGGPINAVQWHPDGASLFSAGYDGVIRHWAPDGSPLGAWPAHHGPIKSLAFSVPWGLVVAGSSDGTLSAWHDGELAWRAAAEDLVLVNSVAADGAGVVVSASRDLQVRRWDGAGGALIEALPRVHGKSIKSISTNPAGDRLLSGSYDGTAVLWRYTDGVWSWKRLLHHGKPGVPATGFGHGPTERLVFTAGWDGSLAWWGIDAAKVGSVVLTGDPATAGTVRRG
ncbi:MAG: WD40 repeat domain-containing protein [Acidimicrobiales bacterium]